MKITDEMLYRHAAEARDIWLDTLPNDDELPNHQFSDEFMANIKNVEAQHKRQKTSRKYLQRVAALFLVFLLGSGTWLAVDIEARATFIQWVRKIAPDYVVYHFIGEAPKEDIPNFYCTWLPEGLEATELYHSNQMGDLYYETDDDWVYCLSYHYMHDGAAHALSASSDEMFHEAVEVNGMPGDYYYEELEEGRFGDLLWFDEDAGIAFSLHGMIPKEDMIRMAESVQEGTPLEYMPEYELTWLPDGYSEGKEMARGSHARQISSLTDGKDLRLKYEIFEAETLEEQFWIESETSGIPLTVQGQDAVLYLNTHRDENSLLWLDKDAGIAFRLDASENEETMLAIAEAVKRK